GRASPAWRFSVIPKDTGESVIAWMAAAAWIRPDPVSPSTPGGPMSTAVFSRAEYRVIGERPACRWNSSAATAAACGALADVPKNGEKIVVATPSGATISGLLRITGAATRWPVASNRIGVGPAAENGSGTGGTLPNAGLDA